jgi:hypothetical protein
MKHEKTDTFNNLIDICIACENDPRKSNGTVEIFRYLLREYFFRQELSETKAVQKIIDNVQLPLAVSSASSILKIDLDKLHEELTLNKTVDTLCGRIILAEGYLNYFYHNFPPSFEKIPNEIKVELIEKIKSRNSGILQAFKKINSDTLADKNRKVITLIALIVKNIHLRSGHPLIKQGKPANEIIASIFREVDQVYVGSGRQNANLLDDSNIRELLKSFFPIYQFSDFNELGVQYKNELERFRKRALRASAK